MSAKMARRFQQFGRYAVALGLFAVVGAAGLRCAIPPDWGANALLHPYRRHALRGWLVRATGTPRRGLIVWLHGVADIRQSGVGFAQRYTRGGADASRADGHVDGRLDRAAGGAR